MHDFLKVVEREIEREGDGGRGEGGMRRRLPEHVSKMFAICCLLGEVSLDNNKCIAFAYM